MLKPAVTSRNRPVVATRVPGSVLHHGVTRLQVGPIHLGSARAEDRQLGDLQISLAVVSTTAGNEPVDDIKDDEKVRTQRCTARRGPAPLAFDDL